MQFPPLPVGEGWGEGPALMFVAYHPGYVVDIGPHQRFPMQKYGLAYERLRREGSLATSATSSGAWPSPWMAYGSVTPMCSRPVTGLVFR